jgi:hypothetical protein
VTYTSQLPMMVTRYWGRICVLARPLFEGQIAPISTTLGSRGRWHPRVLRPGRRYPVGLDQLFFSDGGLGDPAARSLYLLILLGGDIKPNPGPITLCPTCAKRTTSSCVGGRSVFCNNCRCWFHLTCTSLPTLRHYTSSWNCSLCRPVTITSAPQVQQHTPAPPQPPGPLPGPPSPPHPVPPDRPKASTPPTRHQNLNILQLDIDGLRTKHVELKQYMHSNKIHVAIIQETKLRHSHKTPSIPNYTAIRQYRQHLGKVVD